MTSRSSDGCEASPSECAKDSYLKVLTTDELRDAIVCDSIKSAYQEVDGYVRSFDNSGNKGKLYALDMLD